MAFDLFRSRSELASKPQAAEWQILRDFNRSLALIVDLDALRSSIVTRLHELFRADRVVIFQLDADKGLFSPAHALGHPLDDLSGLFFRQRGRLARWLIVNETVLTVPVEAGVYEYLDEPEQALLTRVGARICGPLVSLNRLTGIITLGSTNPAWRLTAEDTERLLALAGQAGLALENALLYQEQRDRLKRLHRAERLAAAGQLAAGVAHDIRNPLTAIRSTIQYLRQDFPEQGPKRELVDEVLTEVDRIDRTVNGLLSLTRTRSFEPEVTDLLDILRQSVTLIRAEARRQEVRIEEAIDVLDARCSGDPGELKQLFVNLLMNALQAMPQGGLLRVEASPVVAEPQRAPRAVRIGIADTGIGIAPEHVERVFDPFFTTKRDGTGLGLAICHGIVERHRGDIDISSEVGRGTRVSVSLPLLAAHLRDSVE